MGGGQSSSSGAGRSGRSRANGSGSAARKTKKDAQDEIIAAHHEKRQLEAHSRQPKGNKGTKAKPLSAADRRAVKVAKAAKTPNKQQRELNQASSARAALQRIAARAAARRKGK